MSTYVYRSKPSSGAQDLAEAINGIRFRGRQVPIDRKVRAGDIVVCWGEAFPNPPAGVRVLNGAPIINKFEDAQKLAAAGIQTIQVSRTRPTVTVTVAPVDPLIELWTRATGIAGDFAGTTPVRNQVAVTAVDEMFTAISAVRQGLRVPAPVAPPAAPVGEWLPRAMNHVGGGDLLNPEDWTPGYFAKKEDIIEEFRVHSFKGRSIRAGIKAPREGFTLDSRDPATRLHPWVRSWDGGWRIKYDGVSSKRAHRELAHAAVAALGLDFGAVDIGTRRDGTLMVLEVNRAPGLVEGTIDVYANAIQGWMQQAA